MVNKATGSLYYGLVVEPPVVVEPLPGVVLPVEPDGRDEVPVRGVVDDDGDVVVPVPPGYVVVGCAVLPGVVEVPGVVDWYPLLPGVVDGNVELPDELDG